MRGVQQEQLGQPRTPLSGRHARHPIQRLTHQRFGLRSLPPSGRTGDQLAFQQAVGGIGVIESPPGIRPKTIVCRRNTGCTGQGLVQYRLIHGESIFPQTAHKHKPRDHFPDRAKPALCAVDPPDFLRPKSQGRRQRIRIGNFHIDCLPTNGDGLRSGQPGKRDRLDRAGMNNRDRRHRPTLLSNDCRRQEHGRRIFLPIFRRAVAVMQQAKSDPAPDGAGATRPRLLRHHVSMSLERVIPTLLDR